MWYKATNALFPPAAVLAGSLFATAAAAKRLQGGFASVANFLAFPWLAGHAWLYLCAHATSEVRLRTRRPLPNPRPAVQPLVLGARIDNIEKHLAALLAAKESGGEMAASPIIAG